MSEPTLEELRVQADAANQRLAEAMANQPKPEPLTADAVRAVFAQGLADHAAAATPQEAHDAARAALDKLEAHGVTGHGVDMLAQLVIDARGDQ